MKLSLPRLNEIIATAGGLVGRPWFNFLGEVVGILGFNKDLPVYSDIVLDAAGLYQKTVSVAAVGGFSYVLQFGAATNDETQGSILLPAHYVNGTDIDVFLMIASSNSNTGNIVFTSKYDIVGVGDAFGTPQTLALTTAAPGATRTLTRVDLGALNGEDFRKGDVLTFYLSRTGSSGGDTHTGDIQVYTVGFKIRSEGIGMEVKFP